MFNGSPFHKDGALSEKIWFLVTFYFAPVGVATGRIKACKEQVVWTDVLRETL